MLYAQTKRTMIRYIGAAATLTFLALLTNFVSVPKDAGGTSASDKDGGLNFEYAPSETLIEDIVSNRDFFVRMESDRVYGEDLLCDVNGELGRDRIGMLLMDPMGIVKSVVFDRMTLAKLWENVSIPAKTLRIELARGGIRLSDAGAVARNIAGLRVEETSRRPNRKTKDQSRREALPQSLPVAERESTERMESGEALTRMRDAVRRNPELSSMESGEILRRFRDEIESKKKSRQEADHE
jgi:hypothetical protein